MVGWYRDPSAPDRFRYWDGMEWTAHATVSEGGDTQRRTWYGGILRNPETFRLLVWLDSKVPVVRGRLGRFTRPVEQRTDSQTWSLRP